MATTTERTETRVEWATPEEGRALLDEQAQQLLGISGEEFLRRWDAGEYRAIADTPGNLHITRLASLIPFGRQNS